MFRKIIASNQSYKLVHDASEKNIQLVNQDNKVCLTAKYFHDNSDGAILLSDFKYQSDSDQNQTGLVKLAADMASEYLSNTQDKCKLLCFPGKSGDEFLAAKDYRSSQIDRLMLRENKISTNEIRKLPKKMKVDVLDDKSATNTDIYQIMLLLKQTYWSQGVDEEYIKKALSDSVFLIIRDKYNQILGLVRYATNNNFAYISDMVVDTNWRKQGIATLLMQQLLILVDEKYEFTALISAKEGDGKEAAPKLYGERFGFVEYDKSHFRDVYFRYIRLSQTHTNELSIAPNIGLMFQNSPQLSSNFDHKAIESKVENKFKS